jgi:hypothetical protein
MADTPQPSVYQLAAVLSDGFAALSDEYHLLSDQQQQLESKLSFAKQQVCTSFIFFTSFFHDEHLSSRPEAAKQL